MKDTILITGMSCANCAAGIEKKLISHGLRNIKVNFSTCEATYSSEKFSKKEVENLIKKMGYGIEKTSTSNITQQEKLFLFCVIFTIPLFSHMFMGKEHFLHNPSIQFLICLPVYLLGTWFFGKSAINSIKNKSLNMDVLITMGSSAAFFYSIYGWYISNTLQESQNFLFFETSAMIITLVLLGNVLEHRSVKKTTSAIKDLSKIQTITAKVEKDNKIIEIDFQDIQKGDILIINNGDKIAADGTIVEGSATIDESMITGESIPILKSKGENVIGGTILLSGNIKVIARDVGEKTILSNIINLVKDAQNNKPRIQRLGDKVSAIFVPIVIIISILTFVISFYLFPESTRLSEDLLIDSLLRAIAVLVISCPCAMGLATPTAVMVGIGRAAKNGILIKGGDTLEKFASIKHIFFDKTGTITTGNFKLKELNIIEGDSKKIKNIIYNLEIHSSHPIAKSLTKELSNFSKKIDIQDITERKGVSISGNVDGNIYEIGSSRILLQEESENKHDIYLTKNKKKIATIDIKDEIKENTEKTINYLNNKNIITTLLSGDNQEKCNSISEKIDFKYVYSNQLPAEKLNKIEDASKQGNTAMVGDGINDAPALSKANIGISISGSTQIAIQSSDIILLNQKNIKQLIKAMSISQHTLLTIKQNLFWAFAYNVVAIPVAMMGFLNPMWGALFMAFSDIIVIGNSIRLKYKKLS